MAELRQKIEEALRAHIPAGGMKALNLYGDLFHDRVPGIGEAVRGAMIAARDAGLIRPCPNNGGHRFAPLRFWDMFIAKGPGGLESYEMAHLVRPLNKHLASTYKDWVYDPEGVARKEYPDMPITAAALMEDVDPVRTVTREHAPHLATLIAKELEEPRSRPEITSDHASGSAIDGRPLVLRFEGWRPVLYEFLPDYTGMRPTDLPVMAPPARHYEIQTGGKLLVMDGKDYGEGSFVDALRKAENDLAHLEIGNDRAANESTLAVYAATGFLDIPLVECFPRLIVDGGVVRGCFVRIDDVPEECRMIRSSSLDQPVLVCLDRARALAEHLGMDVDLAMREIEDSAVSILEVAPGPLHIYTPDGWRATDFNEQFRPRGLDRIPEGQDCFYISERPLEADAPCVDVAMPEAPRFGNHPAIEEDDTDSDYLSP